MAKARKRKELPDLRPRVYSFPEGPDSTGRIPSPPSEDEVRRLANRHGFPAQFDLVRELEDRWFWWRTDVQIGRSPAASVHRDFLRELALRARLLNEAVSKIGILERRLIHNAVLPPHLDLDLLERHSRHLAAAAQVAAKGVPPSARGARGDPYTIELLCKLWRLYQSAFGPNARRLTRTGDQFSGRFFDFANDTLRLFGIRKSNQSLGKAIQKAQAAVAARDAKQRMP